MRGGTRTHTRQAGDFKSPVSTNSTTRALFVNMNPLPATVKGQDRQRAKKMRGRPLESLNP